MATECRVSGFFKEKFGIEDVLCYYWLLDVHFGEDECLVEDQNIQQNLNMLRKAAINFIKRYKERAASKRSMSKIMFDCLLNSYFISDILENLFP